MKIHVKVPATTANLGPGFDAIGLALNLWNEAEFITTNDGKTTVTIVGEGAGKLPLDEKNSIAEAASLIYKFAKKPFTGLQINCTNRVPLGSGLGSSSAAMLTGMLGANGLLGYPLTDEEDLKLAIETEGHPDNVAPAMLGGLVASIVHNDRVLSIKLPARANRSPIHVTIVLPDFDFPTHQARAILPQQVLRKDAIFNISRSIMVTEALRTGDLTLLGNAMEDALHQPYRLPLIPGAQKAMEYAQKTGAAAVALSGAGPSLIAFSSKVDKKIGLSMQKAFTEAGLTSRIFELDPSTEGAEVMIF